MFIHDPQSSPNFPVFSTPPPRSTFFHCVFSISLPFSSHLKSKAFSQSLPCIDIFSVIFTLLLFSPLCLLVSFSFRPVCSGTLRPSLTVTGSPCCLCSLLVSSAAFYLLFFFFFLVWMDNFLWMGLLTTNTCLLLAMCVCVRERSCLVTSS